MPTKRNFLVFDVLKPSNSMKKRSYEDWIDLHWQRELTQEEAQQWQSFLSNQPEFAAQWHLDQQLLLGVRSLNDIPLSNNFTSRVIRSVEHVQPVTLNPLPEKDVLTESRWSCFWSLPLMRAAGVGLMLLLGVAIWQWIKCLSNCYEADPSHFHFHNSRPACYGLVGYHWAGGGVIAALEDGFAE